MIYLLVDLKIVLALHPSDLADLKEALIRGRGANSNRGAYQNLNSYGDAKLSRGRRLNLQLPVNGYCSSCS